MKRSSVGLLASEAAVTQSPPPTGPAPGTSTPVGPTGRQRRGPRHTRFVKARRLLDRFVSDARGRDHGLVSSTTISSCQQAWWRHRWEVLDGYNIAGHAFAYSYISGRVWALKDSQEM